MGLDSPKIGIVARKFGLEHYQRRISSETYGPKTETPKEKDERLICHDNSDSYSQSIYIDAQKKEKKVSIYIEKCMENFKLASRFAFFFYKTIRTNPHSEPKYSNWYSNNMPI